MSQTYSNTQNNNRNSAGNQSQDEQQNGQQQDGQQQNGQQQNGQQQNGQPQNGEPVFFGPRDPSFPLARLPGNTETIRMDSENHEDRRKMRKWLFGIMVAVSLGFMILGAVMACVVTLNMLSTKSEVKTAMLQVVNDSSPTKISEFIKTAQPAPSESIYHAREAARELSAESAKQRNILIEKFLEATNWLSLSPMITLVAFILGVGLTLAIALLRALFREEEEAKSNTLAQISTPVSKLVEYLVEYLQSKFKK